ncbi:MAG TPA: DMT family transporter [Thermoplasmatales archaeon]|nr:DMT family transporter [Thermoplasmatales archaeon]
MEKQKQAYVYATLAVILWSTVASAFKLTLRHVDPFQLLFYASFVSTITLLTVLLLQGKTGLLKTSSKKDYLNSILLGFLNPFLYYIALFKAYSLLPAQETQPLNYTWPIMLTILSIPLLKQRIKPASIAAILTSFTGVLIITTHGDVLGLKFSNPFAVLLALSSAIIWALFWIHNLRDKRDETAKLFLNFLFGFVFILPVTIFFSKPFLLNINVFLGAVYIGLFEMGVTFVLWLKALNLSKTTAQLANLIYLSPFFSLIIIHFTVGEEILTSTVVGLILIVSGIMLQTHTNYTTAKPWSRFLS